MNLLEYADHFLTFLDISEKRRDFIRTKVTRLILEDKIRTEGQLWENISYLADKPISYHEKYAKKLDHSFIHGGRLLHEIIGGSITESEVIDYEEPAALSFRDVLELSGCESQQVQCLESALGHDMLNKLTSFCEDDVRSDFELIAERADKVATALQNKTIFVPRIVTVSFNDGFDIKYRGKLSQKDMEAILVLHKEKLSACRVAKKLSLSTPTILKVWQQAGLEPHFKKHQQRISEETVDKISKGYELGLDIKETASFADVCAPTVARYWKKEGFDLYKNSRWKPLLTEEDKAPIIALAKEGLSISEIKQKQGHDSHTISITLAEIGLEIQKKNKRLTEEKIRKIYEAHEQQMTQQQAASYAGVAVGTVIRYWAEKSLNPHYNGGAGKMISEEKRAKIKEAYSLGMTQAEACNYAEVSEATYKKYQGLLGLERRCIQKKIPESEISRISELRKIGRTLEEITAETGYSAMTIRKYLAQEKINVNTRKLKDEEVKEIIAAYSTYEKSVAEASRHLPYSYATIRKYWIAHNLKPSGRIR